MVIMVIMVINGTVPKTHLELMVGRSLTVHPEANWDLVETVGR